jgi:hypothetical protein
VRRLLLAIVLAPLLLPAAARADRYSYAGGCYAYAGSGPLRMVATDLGRYLLYRPDGAFAGPAGVSGTPVEWVADDAGTLTASGVKVGPMTPAAGCAEYPEAPLSATGTPARGATPFGPVQGLIDGHMHWMTYEYFGGRFHCGKPWDRFGIAFALPDCASIEGPGGTAAIFQNFLNYGNPAQPHDTRGFPYLTETKATNLTREGTYYRWVQRAWMAGLRLMVMGVNENRVLCTLQPVKVTDCDEMATVRRGLDDMRALQRYIDAQAGGPGKGFLQIVTDPFQAREAINAGKLAVVLEIEISEPFGCRNVILPTCDAAKVDRELDDLYRRGVRSALLLNKYDNPLAGTRFDEGTSGLFTNAGNLLSAGTFWSAKTCTGALHDNTILTTAPPGFGALLNTIGVPGLTLPVYPPAPHCNTRGLSKLGAHAVDGLMDRKMIVNPDHMSQAAVDATLKLLERRGYSGVISPHGWMDPGNWPRIFKLGGIAFPGHSTAAQYVDEWKRYRPKSTGFAFGWGYGADLGGLSTQPGASGLTYPFKSLDGAVTFDRQTTGLRTFDYATEGVATYGQYADWFADLKRLGGDRLATDLLNGAEAYLEMWERAEGVKSGCAASWRPKVGESWQALLRRAGQPTTRAATWSWCVKGRSGADVAVLGADGKVALAGSSARGRAIKGLKVGARAKGSGLERRGRTAYLVRKGRIAAVATTTLRGRTLKATMAAVRAARARPSRYVGNAEAVATGTPLAATGNPATDAQLALLCSLLSSAT